MNNNLKNTHGSSNNEQIHEEINYEADYNSFVSKLEQVASYEPKIKYLYAIMDGVAFQDTNNALDIAIENKPVNKGG